MESGSCAQGRKCNFAHGKRELRPGSAAKIGRPASGTTKEASRGKGERHSKEPAMEKDFKASELEGNSLWSRQTTLETSGAWSRQSTLEVPSVHVMPPAPAATAPVAPAASTAAATVVPVPAASEKSGPGLKVPGEDPHLHEVLQVKNTFIQIDSQDQKEISRSHSVPHF